MNPNCSLFRVIYVVHFSLRELYRPNDSSLSAKLVPNIAEKTYKYNNYTRNLVGRSFSRCLHNRLLSGSSMRITIRPFGCALRRALY
jgi:hypothetical protein